jgi:protein gp37
MANKTSIEWTDYNWNFLRGCSRVSEGCRNCYAEAVAARFSGFDDKGKELPYFGLAQMVNGKPRWTGSVRVIPHLISQPQRWTKPRKIFVNSMSDLFHEKVPEDVLDHAFSVMQLANQHTYQILTKRPERMLDYMRRKHPRAGDGPWFNHIWLGVSVEDQKTADERIPLLLETPAAVRWISAEPLLGPVNLCQVYGRDRSAVLDLDWVVVGGESGARARLCNVEWLRSIVDQCRKAGTAVFVKQLGVQPYTTDRADFRSTVMVRENEFHARLSNRKGGDMAEWPEDLRVREMPGVK